MKVDSSIVQYQQNTSATAKADFTLSQDNPIASKEANGNGGSSKVAISGKSLLLSRLFANADSTIKPSGDLLSETNMLLSPVHFLTENDKDLLAKMYEFAAQQGADLQHVDTLGVELGSYRKSNDPRISSDFNNGTNFDLEGHLVTVSFSVEDSKIAERILNGDSIKSTQMDKEFLSKLLNPSSGALIGIGDLGFLEQMVTKFSDNGANATLDSKFAKYDVSSAANNNAVFTKSKEIALHIPQPDIINDNGKWIYPKQQNLQTQIQAALEKSSQRASNFTDELLNALLGDDSKTVEKSKALNALTDLIEKDMPQKPSSNH